MSYKSKTVRVLLCLSIASIVLLKAESAEPIQAPAVAGNQPPSSLNQPDIAQQIPKLNAIALGLHPDANILDTDFDQENGVLVYEVDLIDSQGIKWDVKINSTTGQIIENVRDY